MDEGKRCARAEVSDPGGELRGAEAKEGKPVSRLTLRSAENGDAVTETLWSAVGGSETFERLVDNFYERVKKDEVLSPMYPQQDWEGAKWRLCAFLEQFWGGPAEYTARRGHPRLRMRHEAFAVTVDARNRWLAHMCAAIDEVQIAPVFAEALRDYFARAATALINRFDSVS